MRGQNEISRDPACAGDRGASPAPNLATGAGGAIPADGFYNALVQLDTGGEMNFAVRVHEGTVYTPHQYELRPDACSDFTPLSTWLIVSNWPQYAVDQLDALRAAKAALVEEVERLQAWKDAAVEVESKWDAPAIARLLGGATSESTRTVIAREVPRLVERVKRLEEAGGGLYGVICARWLDDGVPSPSYEVKAVEQWEAMKGES